MNEDDMISLMKAIAWEQAKGQLRTISAAAGQGRTGSRHNNYNRIQVFVDRFINEFEAEGLHE